MKRVSRFSAEGGARARFWGSLIQRLAIDLGSDSLHVSTVNSGARFEIPACVAVRSGSVVAVGEDAVTIQNSSASDSSVKCIWPIRGGKIEDYELTGALLEAVFERAYNIDRTVWPKPHVTVAVSTTMGLVEQRVLRQLLLASGAQSVRLMARPVATAIGMSAPMSPGVESIVGHFGRQASQWGRVGSASWRELRSLEYGVADLVDMIVQYVQDRDHNPALIPRQEVERTMFDLLSLDESMLKAAVELFGSSPVARMPVTVKLTTAEVLEVLERWMEPLAEQLSDSVDIAGNDISRQIFQEGQSVYCSGEICMIPGFAEYIFSTTGITAEIAHSARRSIIDGLALVARAPDSFEPGLFIGQKGSGR